MRFSVVAILGSAAFAAEVRAVTNTTAIVDYNNLTVALVRAAPVNWPSPILNKNWTGVALDLNATVSYGINLIGKAAANGANLVVFPETWFPGYPKGNDNAWIAAHIHEYVENSLMIGSAQWHALLSAAKTNKIYVSLGFSERTNSSLYMAQALISPCGEVLHARHKVRPSGGERDIWSDGIMSDLKVIETPYGRWGMLECWEHFHPTMTFSMQAQLETLHIGAWPYQTFANDPAALAFEDFGVNTAAARLYAVNSGATTLFTSIGYAAVISGSGIDVATINATASYDERPMLYHSINTTASHSTSSYNLNGEQSWGVLQEIEEGWPYYIPKVVGTFVAKKTVLIEALYAYASGYNVGTGESTSPLP